MLMSLIVFFNVWQDKELGENPIGSNPWFATGQTTFNIGVAVDPLGACFLFMVPLACTLIFIYCTGYMADRPALYPLLGLPQPVCRVMMGLVVSDNLL